MVNFHVLNSSEVVEVFSITSSVDKGYVIHCDITLIRFANPRWENDLWKVLPISLKHVWLDKGENTTKKSLSALGNRGRRRKGWGGLISAIIWLSRTKTHVIVLTNRNQSQIAEEPIRIWEFEMINSYVTCGACAKWHKIVTRSVQTWPEA